MKARATIFSNLPKTLLVAEVLITLTLVFGLNAFCDEIFPGPQENAYVRLLDNYIARCDANRVQPANPGLQNVRRAAAVAMLKGTFTKTYRQEMINGPAEDDVAQKSYKVALCLNERFSGSVR